MRYTIGGKKISKRYVFTTIIRVESLDVFIKMFFNSGFKSNENIFNFSFLLERVKPNIFSEMINKNYIVFKAIM